MTDLNILLCFFALVYVGYHVERIANILKRESERNNQ